MTQKNNTTTEAEKEQGLARPQHPVTGSQGTTEAAKLLMNQLITRDTSKGKDVAFEGGDSDE